MSVGEICNRDVVMVEKDATILQAAQLMRRYHIGALVVVEKRGDKNIPIGIFTDRDIVLEVLAEEVDLSSVSIGDVMSYELVTVGEGDGIWDTLQRMRAKGVRRVPVVNDEHDLEGILAVDDLLELLAGELKDLATLITHELKREEDIRH